MEEVEKILNGHVYIKYDDVYYPIPYYWFNEAGELDYNNPLTLKNAYQWLKYILEQEQETDKKAKPTKSEFKQGHRKKMFNEEQVEQIKQLYADGMSKNQIAKIKGCDEKTIRNYLKNN